MNRLETIRVYFIERFFTLLTSHPEFVELTEPAELFDATGSFNVPTNLSGFIRVPTLEGLQKRIDAARSPEQKDELEKFGRILARTLEQMFGSLATASLEAGVQLAIRFAPVIKHPDQQTYWPVDVGHYLNFDDGTLRSRFYSQTGDQSLSGNLFSVMFENSAVWTAPNLPKKPFEAHIPFAATIGIDGSLLPFPASPLTAGHLNLPAADARLIPGRLQPTIFAEIKSLGAAIRTNRHYTMTASGGGRFNVLQRNRIHTDPILRQLSSIAGRATMETVPTAMMARLAEPIMLMFQSFYPADDGARRKNDGTGTNREFHHLAVGLLLAEQRQNLAAGSLRRQGLLFLSSSPTEAKAVPLNHPSLQFLDDAGQPSPEGRHPVIFANTLATQGYGYQGGINKDPLKDTAKDGLDYNPDDGEWWLGLAGAVGTGALAGAVGGPIGAAIGAAVGLLIYLLAWLLKKLFGGKKDRQKEWTEQKPWPGNTNTQSFQQSSSHDIGPSGITSETGGSQPGRSYDLKVIPHFPDKNLYGLAFAGGDTCRIVEDSSSQEMLAWLAFEGGIGYQFDRPLPGRAESSGTSIQNYFELFIQKFLDLQKAEAEVVYFGA